jgi:hypothetical protein
VFDSLGRVPAPLVFRAQFVQQGQLMIPGQSRKHRLHKFGIGPGFGERPHVLEIARREAFHLGKGTAQVVR